MGNCFGGSKNNNNMGNKSSKKNNNNNNSSNNSSNNNNNSTNKSTSTSSTTKTTSTSSSSTKKPTEKSQTKDTPKKNVDKEKKKNDDALKKKIESLWDQFDEGDDKSKKTGQIDSSSGEGSSSESSEESSEEPLTPWELLLESLDIDVDSIESCVANFKLGFESVSPDKALFLAKMFEHKIDSKEGLKDKIDEWTISYQNNTTTLKEVWKHAFLLHKDEDTNTLDIEVACFILSMLGENRPHISTFIEFLENQSETDSLNSDQWSLFLEFSLSVNETFTNYDSNSAWPVILDEYASWYQKKQSGDGDQKDDDQKNDDNKPPSDDSSSEETSFSWSDDD